MQADQLSMKRRQVTLVKDDIKGTQCEQQDNYGAYLEPCGTFESIFVFFSYIALPPSYSIVVVHIAVRYIVCPITDSLRK